MKVSKAYCVANVLSAICACTTTPPPVVSDQAVATHVGFNRANPPRIGFQYYPETSKHAGEQGTCIVRLTVMSDGTIKDVHITQSTGYPALDQASMRAFQPGTLRPATENGHPIDDTIELPVTWKITRLN